METVKAQLSGIRYQNDTGFIIGMFTEDRPVLGRCASFAALGNMFNPELGMDYALHGTWTEHHQFGRQFNFSAYETQQPRDKRGIFNYLVRTAKWVGSKIGETLVETYGEETLTVLKTRPEEVAAKIKGITPERAKQIQEALVANEHNEAALVQLNDLLNVPGMRRDLPTTLLREYGSSAPARLREDPYIITKIKGVGFPTADIVALKKIGLAEDSIFRKAAAAKYIIETTCRAEGSVWISRERVVSMLSEMLGPGAGNIEEGLDILIKGEKAVEFDGHVAIAKRAFNESYVAHKIANMMLAEDYEKEDAADEHTV